MVSQFWAAVDAGDAAQVQLILAANDASIDIESRDEKGATPLVQAVMNGHVHVVKILLDAGSDPYVSSAHGSLDQLTQDPAILEMLTDARNKRIQATEVDHSSMNGMNVHSQAFVPPPEGFQPPQEFPTDPSKPPYYGQPQPASYMYYPVPFQAPNMLPDGTPAPFYPPPPHMGAPSPDGGNNLPPPEIARQIPCRYFPACRYGPSCIFAHPQGPYFQGPLPPPAQYSAPYDPMAQGPYGGYYGMPQPPYPPNGLSPVSNAMSPPPAGMQSPLPQAIQHTRSGSEAMMPMQPPFSPNGPPPPLPYGMGMPAGYPAPGQMPPHMMGPPPTQAAIPAAQPNGAPYDPTSPTSQARGMHSREPSAAMGVPPFQPEMEGGAPNGINGYAHQPGPHPQDAYANGARMHPRDGMRRGSRRMGSIGARPRPPCAFFPTGKCRNGDVCPFPHVLPDANDTQFNGRPMMRSKPPAMQKVDQLADKMQGLQLRTDVGPSPAQTNGHQNGQVNGFVRPHNGYKNGYGPGKRPMNGHNHGYSHREPQQSRQRVPSADEFPVLSGSTTPPARSPAVLNGVSHGPTAAQVLQAPAPAKKATSKASSMTKGSDSGTDRASSPSENGSEASSHAKPNGLNGVNSNVVSKSPAPASEVKGLSFAAVATNGVSPAHETVSTVSVSA